MSIEAQQSETTINSSPNLLRRMLRRRAQSPLKGALLDGGITGALIGSAISGTAYQVMDTFYKIQTTYQMVSASKPIAAELNKELLIDAAVTYAFYFVYYYTDVRVLNPLQTLPKAWKGMNAFLQRRRNTHENKA